MAKIYRRDNLIAGVTPKPKSKKRKRSVIMNFRVSPEEKNLLMTGLHYPVWAKQIFSFKAVCTRR